MAVVISDNESDNETESNDPSDDIEFEVEGEMDDPALGEVSQQTKDTDLGTASADDTESDSAEGDGCVVTPKEQEVASGAEATPKAVDDSVWKQKVAELEQQKKETWDRLVRTTADIENLRKRTRREIEDAKTDTRIRTLREVLPVVDNLERALEHFQSDASDGDTKGIAEGVNLVLRQFHQVLDKFSVVLVEGEGHPFDPNIHEAISQQPTADVPPGTVVSCIQNGYKIGKKLLRPALVIVSVPAVETVQSEEEVTAAAASTEDDAPEASQTTEDAQEDPIDKPEDNTDKSTMV